MQAGPLDFVTKCAWEIPSCIRSLARDRDQTVTGLANRAVNKTRLFGAGRMKTLTPVTKHFRPGDWHDMEFAVNQPVAILIKEPAGAIVRTRFLLITWD